MPDIDDPGLTSGHPSAHLRAAPDPDESVPTTLSATYPAEALLPYDVVSYGPDIPTEATFRLLGHLDGKRVLELGCGAGHAAVAMAKQGAHVISVDPSHRRLERVRTACDREEVRVELHQSDLAELAFIRADTVDAVLSVFALAAVPDLDRVFRQAHRVLRSEGPLVLSIPHPSLRLANGESYFDRSPRPWQADEGSGEEFPRTISDVFTGLTRANFRVDTLLEPPPADGPRSSFWHPSMAVAPATLVMRARKEGL